MIQNKKCSVGYNASTKNLKFLLKSIKGLLRKRVKSLKKLKKISFRYTITLLVYHAHPRHFTVILCPLANICTLINKYFFFFNKISYALSNIRFIFML